MLSISHLLFTPSFVLYNVYISLFQYLSADDKNLQRVREYFQLDTIPGKDDELTHIKNLYYFVCKNRSCFNPESIYRNTQQEDIRLIPAGFVNDNFGKAATTTNPKVFWVKP